MTLGGGTAVPLRLHRCSTELWPRCPGSARTRGWDRKGSRGAAERDLRSVGVPLGAVRGSPGILAAPFSVMGPRLHCAPRQQVTGLWGELVLHGEWTLRLGPSCTPDDPPLCVSTSPAGHVDISVASVAVEWTLVFFW